MAHLDNLIESVKDPTLRAALHAEIDKVTKNRRLGLVFDRHLPESVTLPGFTIRQGEKVQVITEGSDDPTDLDDTGIWTVIEMRPATAVLRDGAGQTREVPVSQLVATREFGDPIYPGLKPTGRVLRGGGTDGDDGGKPFHTVINAENYHALEALLFAYEGQVDAIYIDPPYNTGARDWKYNNDYVDDNDPYRHSKWLSFIERRLLLAKRLLNPADSVLIVTIDEKEYLRLGLLLEQTFPAAHIQMATVVINPSGTSRGYLSRVEEYVFFCFLGDALPHDAPDDLLSELEADGAKIGTSGVRWEWLLRGGGTWYRDKRPNLCYPVLLNDDRTRMIRAGDPLVGDESARPETIDGHPVAWPVRSDGRLGIWRVDSRKLNDLIAKGYAHISSKPHTAQPTLRYLLSGTIERIASGELVVTGHGERGEVQVEFPEVERVQRAKTVWRRGRHTAGGAGGAQLLNQLLVSRGRFQFPKSLYAVEDTLRIAVGNKPDALVLDFFAGSGTTAHAVMRLNKQDGGRRRSVMVTNNEVSADERASLRADGHRPGDTAWEDLGICEFVTKPRIRAAITGATPAGEPIAGNYGFTDEFPISQGFQENAEFFTLTYEDPGLVTLGRRFDAIAPLLWLRAGCSGARIDHVEETGWSLPADAVYGVLFDTTAWGAFVSAAAKREDLRHAFIVTDSIVEYQQIVAKLDPALKTTRLYADYLRNFEINTRR
ncbi:DNA methyltransferase [Cellulosimicrobium marinum]|uniref:DNA methyltransferase n=1 Tax=Cellulosimicrobium marinum TaxID=1638992 RepID=UPI001E5A4406|nr:DNA methyltransferase [Cellulosimicrobium marinum]MCB7138260.1 site-specific DNA-methyltransferase [Cellulosimicrobium marinum]